MNSRETLYYGTAGYDWISLVYPFHPLVPEVIQGFRSWWNSQYYVCWEEREDSGKSPGQKGESSMDAGFKEGGHFGV